VLQDKLHRTTNRRAYQRSIDDAHRIVEQALERFGEPAAVGVSGGKDSVAMCHVVAQHCRPLVIWNDSGIELPESEGVVRELAAQLGLDVEVARGVDAFGRLVETAAQRFRDDQTDELCIIAPVRRVLSERGIRLEFVGLRSGESRRRKMVIAMHGPIYDSKRFGCGIAWPLRRWSAADVFAYIDEHELPLHPAYTRTDWQDRESIRVSWAWDPTRERLGDIEYLRRYYPALYRRIRNEVAGVY
jgi:phosphoadenosine phosphosulfate reductase